MNIEGFHRERVYLDHNATTPLDENLKPQIVEWLNEWGNPSSIHWSGRGPKAILREARKNISDFLIVHTLEIVFTSSGSEANNMAIKGVFEKLRNTSRNHYICSAVEHPSVLKTMEYLSSCGARVGCHSCSSFGRIGYRELSKPIIRKDRIGFNYVCEQRNGSYFSRKKTNQEWLMRWELYITVMGVQALGKVPIHPAHLGVDLCSFSAHKFYSLKGCGVLYIKKGTQVTNLIHGGSQERKRRAGTENLLSVASLGVMVSRASDIVEKAVKTQRMRDFLQKEILENLSGVRVTGGGDKASSQYFEFSDRWRGW